MTDKVEILGSPLGMYSLLRDDYIISVLRDDGSLDEEKTAKMAAAVANMGANAMRDFYWIDTQDAYEKISPFLHEGGRDFRFNDRFFANHRRIAQILNRYNLRFYFCLFDHCGTKISNRANVGEFNPWRFFDNFFYREDAADLRHQYIERAIDAFSGLDVGVELCNEPAPGHGLFLADTFIYLLKKSFDPSKIIIGIDYHLKESLPAYGNDYRVFRDKIAEELGKNWTQDLKSVCISPVHNADEKGIDSLWRDEASSGGTRRILYSMDGVGIPPNNDRPDKTTMIQIARKVLRKKTKAREQGKILFEILYGKTKNDPLDSIEGVSEAYRETWGQYPENWRKFTDVQPGVAPSFNNAYVTHGYRALLGRDPDRTGLSDYVHFLENDGTVTEFCRKLTESEEFNLSSAILPPADLAQRLFREILGRDADENGLTHTIEEICNGRIAERAAAMIESTEFKDKFC